MTSHLALVAASLLLCLPGTPGVASATSPDRTLPWVTGTAVADRVVKREFFSRLVGANVSYHAYVPDIHDRAQARLPVLYWLHGTEGGIAGIRPLAKLLDDAIATGTTPPMIVIFVNGLPRRLWADSKNGKSPIESVFIREVIPDVDATFRTVAAREGRILEGFSMGGYGAARLGFKYPELFAAVSVLAGGPLDPEFDGPRARRNPRLRAELLREVCDDDMEYFRAISPWMLAASAAPRLRADGMLVRQVVGLLDDTRGLNRRFHERMVELGITHQYLELPGVGHDIRDLLTGLGARNAEFYREALARAFR